MRDEMPWRRDCIGASEAPAIVGCDPFSTSGDVWARKTGRAPSTRDDGPEKLTPATLGSAIGPLLVDAAAAYAGRRDVVHETWYRHPTAPLAVSVDGLVIDPPPLLIEAKTVGLLAPAPPYAQAYGDDGTDAVPDALRIQVHHAFIVLDAQPDLPPVREAIAPVLIGGRGLHFYRIHRDDALVASLFELEQAWWRDYVEADRCPPRDPPSLAILRQMPRQATGPAKALDPVFVNEWLQAKAVLKQAEANEESVRRMILADLGDAEVGECVVGRLTYRLQHRAAYTVAAQAIRVLRFSPHRAV